MKKVLIITYYWPPTGGSGVQRWLKTSKYLPELGWEPIIYTPENPDVNATDEALLKDVSPNMTVLKRRITEPYGMYKKFTGKKKESKIKAHLVADNPMSLKDRISIFIRGNFFIPDPRCWWIRPSVKFLCKYLKEHPVDLIVSTGPPHSMHLIAKKTSLKTGIKWVADFRDPWTEIFYYDQLHLTRFADKINRKMEQSVLDNASAVFVVTKEMQQSYSMRTKTPIHLITNGFDHADFLKDCCNNDSNKFLLPDNNHFNIVYTGLFSENRNMEVLWRVLGEKSQNNKEFRDKLRITLMGQIDDPIIDSIKNAGLIDNFRDLKYTPHEVAIIWQKAASILLLALVKGKAATAIIPGKFFEYMASGTPILAFGAVNSNLGDVMRETECGEIVEFDDYDSTKSFIDNQYDLFVKQNGTTKEYALSEKVMKYSRKSLAGEMVKRFNMLVK